MIAAATALAALAVGGALRLAARRRRAPELAAAGAPAAAATVLVPMRDEIENVDACLAALGALAPRAPVRVLDDGSTDGTRERALALAGADPALAVLAVPPPPSGVNGKVHALAHGSREVATEWLLALDADARPAPAALARAIATADERGLGALSLAARQRARRGEALVTPPVFALLDALLGDWRAAAGGAAPPVANGQFLLVRRAALDAAGGYEALLHEPLDDVALARRLAAAGFKVGFFRGRELLEARMYRGFVASFRGWRRNLALLFGERPAPALLALAAAAAPALLAAAALAAGEPGAALAAWAGGALASLLLRAGTGSAAGWGLLYPLDALAAGTCLVLALADFRRGRVAAWRGRPVARGG